MTMTSNFSSRMTAAFSALALSIITIVGTVSVPSPAQAHTVYVGAIA